MCPSRVLCLMLCGQVASKLAEVVGQKAVIVISLNLDKANTKTKRAVLLWLQLWFQTMVPWSNMKKCTNYLIDSNIQVHQWPTCTKGILGIFNEFKSTWLASVSVTASQATRSTNENAWPSIKPVAQNIIRINFASWKSTWNFIPENLFPTYFGFMKPKADPLQFGGALLPFFFLMSDFRFAIKPSSSHKSWKKSFRCNDCTKACRDGFGSCAFRLACPGHVFHNFAQRTDFF